MRWIFTGVSVITQTRKTTLMFLLMTTVLPAVQQQKCPRTFWRTEEGVFKLRVIPECLADLVFLRTGRYITTCNRSLQLWLNMQALFGRICHRGFRNLSLELFRCDMAYTKVVTSSFNNPQVYLSNEVKKNKADKLISFIKGFFSQISFKRTWVRQRG